MIELAYLIAVSLFIVGLKRLGSPATARSGNRLAAAGMALAVAITFADPLILNIKMIGIALIIGSLLGALSARLVKMTAMPQMVALQNGLGGGASALVAIAEYSNLSTQALAVPPAMALSIFSGIFIGSITFTGSLIAFAKLQGVVRGAPIAFRGQKWLNTLFVVGFIASAIFLWHRPADLPLLLLVIGLPLCIGILFTLPIGGADMPVVISLLNSCSGLAASAAGFVVQNSALIVAGALVGASGLILTQIMCRAMNRSLINVLFSGFGQTAKKTMGEAAGRSVRSTSSAEAAMLLGFARLVVFVPGYGMAVSQAQHALRELADELERRSVAVKYAIHPVAGRMPGHMNVLLAEADVPYTKLYDMDDINPEFERTDVVVVIGANDVVNPAARTEQGSPIYGMPILNVDKAKQVIVIKRSMSPGFAGIDNELFYRENTAMLFGEAKEMLVKLLVEIKEL